MAYIKTKVIFFVLLFAVMFISPPEVNSQAYINYDTLKTTDTTAEFTIAPYGDEIYFALKDSNNGVTDSVKVYEILPTPPYDTVGIDAVLTSATGTNINTLFIPGDNSHKLYKIVKKQVWKLKFVSVNDSAHSKHKIYVSVTARTRYYNSIFPAAKSDYASTLTVTEKTIFDKLTNSRHKIYFKNDNFLLLNPFSLPALSVSKKRYNRKE